MGFHRLTSPSYFGGLPGGYDLINAGTAPALADGAKVGGPNEGTFFHAFGEQATAANFNRPAKALAQNCDYLDDLFHRDVAAMHKTADTVALTNLSTIVLPAGVFLGLAGYTNTAETISLLFSIRSSTDRPLLDATGLEIVVAGVTLSGGDAIGGGYSQNSVTLNLSTTLPASSTYRVYYGARANLATLSGDELLNPRTFGLLYTHLYPPYGSTGAHLATSIIYEGGAAQWADSTTHPRTNVALELNKIVADLGGVDGAVKIGSALISGPLNLAAGTVRSQLSSLLGIVTALLPNRLFLASSVTATAFNTFGAGGGTAFYDIPGMSVGLSGCVVGDIFLVSWSGTFFMDDPSGVGEVKWYVDDGGPITMLTESITTVTIGVYGLIKRHWALARIYTVANSGTVTFKAQLRSLGVSANAFFEAGFIDILRIHMSP